MPREDLAEIPLVYLEARGGEGFQLGEEALVSIAPQVEGTRPAQEAGAVGELVVEVEVGRQEDAVLRQEAGFSLAVLGVVPVAPQGLLDLLVGGPVGFEPPQNLQHFGLLDGIEEYLPEVDQDAEDVVGHHPHPQLLGHGHLHASASQEGAHQPLHVVG